MFVNSFCESYAMVGGDSLKLGFPRLPPEEAVAASHDSWVPRPESRDYTQPAALPEAARHCGSGIGGGGAPEDAEAH